MIATTRKRLWQVSLGKGLAAQLVAVLWMPLAFGLEGAWWALRRRHVSTCLTLAVLATFLLNSTWMLITLLGLAGAFVAGSVRGPRAFRLPAREGARRVFYARGWDRSMTLCGLMKRDVTKVIVPRLVAVRCSPYFDHLTLHLQPGQERQDAQDCATKIAATFSSDACRVYPVERKWWHGRGTRVRLDLQRQDALAEVVARLEIPDEVNLEAVAIGRTEYGETWCINLLGTHYLIGGATGSGKGSMLWSIVNGIAPAIRDGLVDLWGIDPKGGQELIHGREMFSRYVGENADLDEAEALLAELVGIMKARSSQFAESRARKPTVSVDEPLILCVIDEMADLTTCPDSKQKNRINGYLSLLCRRGRSVGITLLMLLQDARMEAVPFRRQIPHGIGLRLEEPFEVDAVCGHGAFKAGARCTEIPGAPEPGQPLDGRGVAFMTTLGVKTPLRVRASYITDEDLAGMAERFPAFDRAPLSAEAAERIAQLAVGSSDEDRCAVEQEFSVDDESEA